MNGTTIAFAAATFGLVSGSFIGGPIGELLVRRFSLISHETDNASEDPGERPAARIPKMPRRLTSTWITSCTLSGSCSLPWVSAPM